MSEVWKNKNVSRKLTFGEFDMYEIKDKPLFERTYIFKHYIEIICDIDDATTLPAAESFSCRDWISCETAAICCSLLFAMHGVAIKAKETETNTQYSLWVNILIPLKVTYSLYWRVKRHVII